MKYWVVLTFTGPFDHHHHHLLPSGCRLRMRWMTVRR
jgi:hypothetical protein